VDIAAIGYCQDDTSQTASAYHKNTGRYRRVFLDEQRRVIGATLIGETNDAGIYYHWVRTRSVFPGKKALHRSNTYAGVMQSLA
jgi:NAD(P)H-nitrite reductase large subunit